MKAKQIIIVCLIKAKQGTKNEVREELGYLAKMTQKEKGNLHYNLHISSDDDSLFIIYESWMNQEALDNHMEQPYLKDFLAKQESLLEYPVDGKICELIE
jgi:quinol monooxygenase YgiN